MKEKEIRNLLADKRGITELNAMQERMLQISSEKRDIILLSPTGSGKTIAFGVPLLKMLKEPSGRIQAVIIAPGRELVIQIAEAMREISGQFRVIALYGGHKVEDEINSLKVVPDFIVATPGRLLDHINRRNLDVISTSILVLDEFDKSLELGFEEEMKKIIKHLKNLSRIILTSATDSSALPDFLPIKDPVILNFLNGNRLLKNRMRIRNVIADGKDKLNSLLFLLRNISNDQGIEKTIIFVNHRESAERVYEFLRRNGVSCVLYNGGLDQSDRELSLAAFNSGAKPVMVATDLAARGLDIEGIENVIHYHLPLTRESYTHRNGRTARIDNSGDVYIIQGREEELKDFITPDSEFDVDSSVIGKLDSGKALIRISAGKKEKLSKGDILGYLLKEVGLPGEDVGKIFLFDHFSLVAVNDIVAEKVIELSKLKKIKGEKRKFIVVR